MLPLLSVLVSLVRLHLIKDNSNIFFLIKDNFDKHYQFFSYFLNSVSNQIISYKMVRRKVSKKGGMYNTLLHKGGMCYKSKS